MVWRKLSESTIGGNYTWYDSNIEGIELLPLLYCIGNAFPATDRRERYWHYIPALFTPDEEGYAGGDPGWRLRTFTDEQGNRMYYAWSDHEMSGLEPEDGDYDEFTVKRYFVRTMREYSRIHPETREFIENLIDQYKLIPQ